MMRFTKAERQAIVDDFIERHGRYDPAAFVEEARSPQHPAHGWFEWDDKQAAHDHRLWQARSFVRDLRVRFDVEVIERGAVKVRQAETPALISPMETRRAGGGYVPVRPDDPDAMSALCAEAARALDAWLRRYSGAVVAAGGSVKPLEAQARALRKHAARDVDAA